METLYMVVLICQNVGALAGVIFALMFGLRVPWWKSRAGRHIFTLNFGITCLLGSGVLVRTGLLSYEVAVGLQTGLYVIIAFAMVGQVALQWTAQRDGRRLEQMTQLKERE